MKVYVYRNLHKNCFSIKALEGEKKGRVIGHATDVSLYDVEFRVSEKGRQRVLREKKKYVHAGVVGKLLASEPFSQSERERLNMRPIRYNPYETETFQTQDGTPIHSAIAAYLSNNRIYACYVQEGEHL